MTIANTIRPGTSETPRQLYLHTLRQLCVALDVPSSDTGKVIETEVLVLDGVVVGLELSEDGRQVLVMLQLEDPPGSPLEQAHHLLEVQASMPAPFGMIFCRMPRSGRYFMRTHANLPATPSAVGPFVAFLRSAVELSRSLWAEV